MIAIQNLRQRLKRFHSVHWRKLGIGLIGVVFFIWGFHIIDRVNNDPLRRTHYTTSVIYEPVLEKALSDPEASMDLNFAPIVLTIPDRVKDPVHIVLKMPVLAAIELVPSNQAYFEIFIDLISGKGYNPFYIDGPSIQRFNQSIPGELLGITLDSNQTYTATIHAAQENKRNQNTVEAVGNLTQELSPQTEALWAWTMQGLKRGLGGERTKFDVVVNDQKGALAGRAIVTLSLSNPVGVWPFIPILMLIIGLLLMFIGFSDVLNKPCEQVLAMYLSNKNIRAIPHQHRFGCAALMWELRKEQQEALVSRTQTSPFLGATTQKEFDPFQTIPLAVLWLDRQAYVPLTRAFRKRLQYQIIMNSRERIKQFQDLRTLSDDAKRKLRPAMRRLSHEMAKFEVRKETWRTYLWALNLILAYPLFLAIWFNPLDSIVPASVLQVLQLAYNRLLQANNIYANLVIKVLFVVFGIMVIYIYFLPIFFPSFLIKRWQNRKWRDHHPDAIIVDGLIGVLHGAEKSDAQWMSMDRKRDLTAKLETIAHTLERFLPQRLRTNDVGANTLFQQRASEIAAAIRDLKLWVLTPQADTREHFLKRISLLLEHALGSEWGAMPYTQPPSLLRPKLLLPKILNVVRTLIIAILPLVIVALAIQSRFLQPDNTVTQYLAGGALVYAIISMMTAIDSDFSAKIDFFGKVSEIPGKVKDALMPKSAE